MKKIQGNMGAQREMGGVKSECRAVEMRQKQDAELCPSQMTVT